MSLSHSTIHRPAEPPAELGTALLDIAGLLNPGESCYIEIRGPAQRRVILIMQPEDAAPWMLNNGPVIQANCSECGEPADVGGLNVGMCGKCALEAKLPPKNGSSGAVDLEYAELCVDCGTPVESDGRDLCFRCYSAHEGRERRS